MTGEECSKLRGDENFVQNVGSIDRQLTLKWNSLKYDSARRLDSRASGQGPTARSCEHGNEISGLYEELLDPRGLPHEAG